MAWKLDNGRPVYIQIVEHLKQDILSGKYQPGEKVASVRELASEAGVNPNTMQRVFQELEREGLMYSNRTTGRFITEDAHLLERLGEEQAMHEVKQYYDKMRGLGYQKEQMIFMIEKYAMNLHLQNEIDRLSES